MAFNSLELDVIRVLDEIGRAYGGMGKKNAQWTCRIKSDLADLAQSPAYGYQVRATGCGLSEWLFDMTWLKVHGSQVVDVPLVVESEWRETEIAHDFLKLVVARARHRFMIFEPSDPRRIPQHMMELGRTARACGVSARSDRYVFSAWDYSAKQFRHEQLVVP